MRFSTTKVQSLDARQDLPFSTFNLKKSFFSENSSRQYLSALVQGWFNILTHEENNNVNLNKKLLAIDIQDNKSEESDSLQHLEDCANAARGTEAFSQDEWMEE